MSSGHERTFPGLPPIAVAMGGLDAVAIGLAGVAPGGERVRGVIAWLAGAGARALRLDATAPGIRPRELDRSGRRDLAALLRRSELAFAGIDMFIPPEHLSRPETAERAMSSVLAAIDLAADLGALSAGSVVTRGTNTTPPSVSVVLPEKLPEDVRRTIGDHAMSRGVRVADHAWPIIEGPAGAGPHEIGAGVDPATALAAGVDPVGLAAKLGTRLACARLSDVPKGVGAGGGCVAPGSGRLDVMAYLVTLSTTGYAGHAVLDMHGLRGPGNIVREVMERAVGGGR
jgi:sugar phosphate isomerase/epimerase